MDDLTQASKFLSPFIILNEIIHLPFERIANKPSLGPSVVCVRSFVRNLYPSGAFRFSPIQLIHEDLIQCEIESRFWFYGCSARTAPELTQLSPSIFIDVSVFLTLSISVDVNWWVKIMVDSLKKPPRLIVRI